MRPHRTRSCAAGTSIAALVLATACSATPTSTTTSTAVTSGSLARSSAGSSAVSNPTSTQVPSAPPAQRREFLFQIDRYHTANQGGQTLNMYFHYRYDAGIADADIPNFLDLRTQAITFMDSVDTSQNPFWEVLNQQLCGQLHDNFPIEAITCQLQVYPDDRTGTAYEPGFHSSIDTIGDIEPLAVAGPISTG